MHEKQWQYGMTIVFGLLLFFIPWLLGFESKIPLRSWDFFVIGALTVVCGAAALHLRARVAAWLMPALGLWMFLSPWILGFMPNISARNSALVLGGFVFLMSLWALLERIFAGRRPRSEAEQT
jgi:hypothetical protein